MYYQDIFSPLGFMDCPTSGSREAQCLTNARTSLLGALPDTHMWTLPRVVASSFVQRFTSRVLL